MRIVRPGQLLDKNSLKAAEKFSHEEPNKDLQCWDVSHLFSACLVEEAFELSVAYLFLNPFPFDALRLLQFCSHTMTGFLFLLFSLVVDINNDLSQDDVKEVNENCLIQREGASDLYAHKLECFPHGIDSFPQPFGLIKKRYDDSDKDIRPCHEYHEDHSLILHLEPFHGIILGNTVLDSDTGFAPTATTTRTLQDDKKSIP
ncbi:hypothetical protein KIW84_062574 [Lathyrus oleraceus]|uniref:Uncharacterized protein n=1 Tax=Pisum sativum TaxID=3888 RepID=A0A9D5A8I3_PEA|nr:hypothetical protein KIW84_062574 [Pisum sativum]